VVAAAVILDPARPIAGLADSKKLAATERDRLAPLIRERARAIGLGIAARRERFPHETPFAYRPHVEAGEAPRWDEAAKASMRDYNLLDLSI
jgi:ribonuclease HII